MLDRYDALVPLRYYETELKALLILFVNSIYLFKKNGLYSEVFYNLQRLKTSSEKSLDKKTKIFVLLLSLLDGYGREKLDQVIFE